MKKIYSFLAFFCSFFFIVHAEAAVAESTICSIYFDTLSECNTARSAESSGSTLTACTYTAGSGYQWCVSGSSSSLSSGLDTSLSDNYLQACLIGTYSTQALCQSNCSGLCVQNSSTGCYSCSELQLIDTDLTLTVKTETVSSCPNEMLLSSDGCCCVNN